MLDSSLLPFFVLMGIPGAICLYGSYWAFTIRRALVARLYRVQSLWVGVVGVYLAGLLYAGEFTLIASLAGANLDPVALGIFGVLLFGGFVMIFAWVDATVRLARQSDPLARDTLHWSRLRVVLWGLLFLWGLLIVTMVIAIFIEFIAPQLIASVPAPAQVSVVGLLIPSLSTFLIPGAAALLLSGIRSRDPNLRKHLKWFGLFVASGLFVTVIGLITLVAKGGLLFSPALLAPPYCLYKSARSLTQISRLPPVAFNLPPSVRVHVALLPNAEKIWIRRRCCDHLRRVPTFDSRLGP